MMRVTILLLASLAVSVLGVEISKSPDAVLPFPDNFKFGSASAAYQIEGAWNLDGKGPSIWDTFTHTWPERIDDRSNGDDAALSYFLYKEDVRILKELNAQFYRFSVSWPRVLPTGEKSSRNQLGIDYYHNLIDELIANDIEPMITMYHWDLPQALQDLGGFMNPMLEDYFEEYADLLFEEYGSKVKEWITFNEPHQYCGNGYSTGSWAPGIELQGVGDYMCAHHTVLAHARAYHLYKDKYFATQQGRVGITLSVGFHFPQDESNSEHVRASNRALQFEVGMYAHPLTWGDYPELVRESVDRNSAEEGRLYSRLPVLSPEQIEFCRGTTDFIGLNYYTSRIVNMAEEDYFPVPSIWRDTFINSWHDETWPQAKSDWLFSKPEGLYRVLMWMKEYYDNIETLITENGWSDDGELNDVDRTTYLREHYHSIHRAIQDGCHVTAHATWSIIDNFEWLRGYTEKFGIYRVDIADPERIRVIKDSAKFLAELFQARALTIED